MAAYYIQLVTQLEPTLSARDFQIFYPNFQIYIEQEFRNKRLNFQQIMTKVTEQARKKLPICNENKSASSSSKFLFSAKINFLSISVITVITFKVNAY